MRGIELKRTRQRMNLDRVQFAELIGYTGTPKHNADRVRSYENGKRQIPLYIAKAVWLLAAHWRRTGEFPKYPDWPGYDFESVTDPGHTKKETSDVT